MFIEAFTAEFFFGKFDFDRRKIANAAPEFASWNEFYIEAPGLAVFTFEAEHARLVGIPTAIVDQDRQVGLDADIQDTLLIKHIKQATGSGTGHGGRSTATEYPHSA